MFLSAETFDWLYDSPNINHDVSELALRIIFHFSCISLYPRLSFGTPTHAMASILEHLLSVPRVASSCPV